MLTVACVEHGNYEGRGREYVDKLAAMVGRWLTVPYEFHCIRPNVGLTGWWNKVYLFKRGLFRGGRILYLDLDTVIVGPLDQLVQHKGILHLDRWGWSKKVYGSGVMCWDADEHTDIWARFAVGQTLLHEGDQNWIQACGEWPSLPDGLCVSYRYHCKKGPPPGASVVCFHGRPKCHEFAPNHWVTRAWG